MMNRRINVPEDIKALIFDIDGTLADTMSAHLKAFRKVLSGYGINYTEKIFYELAGLPVVPTMYEIQKRFNPIGFDPEKVAIEKETEYQRTLDETKPIKIVYDILKAYAGQLPIACGTGSDSVVAKRVLKIIGAFDKVDVLVASDDVESGKPAPDTFLKCAELLGVAPEDCLVFEDGELGIQAAKVAGIQVVDVRLFL